MKLNEFFARHNRAALCFSGGVDSAYLLYAGLKNGAQIQPYYLKTEFQPEFELKDAERLAKELGAQLRILEMSILEIPSVVQNDAQRCYYCKSGGLGALFRQAKADGYDIVLDGSNADDDPDERPGMRALHEMGILSPLRIANLTKKEIRELSKQAGLFTWNKPAYACLATRIPTDVPIDADTLQKIERSEQALFDMGFTDFRVRILQGCARIQLRAEQMEQAILLRERILKEVCFEQVLLDLYARG